MPDLNTKEPHEARRKSQLLARVYGAPSGDELPAFYDFCTTMLLLADQGEIAQEDAMYSIAGLYGSGRFDDNDRMEEIMQLAFDLEVPGRIDDMQWRKIHRLVAKLSR